MIFFNWFFWWHCRCLYLFLYCISSFPYFPPTVPLSLPLSTSKQNPWKAIIAGECRVDTSHNGRLIPTGKAPANITKYYNIYNISQDTVHNVDFVRCKAVLRGAGNIYFLLRLRLRLVFLISAPAPAPASAIYCLLKLYYIHNSIYHTKYISVEVFFVLASSKLSAVNIY